MSARVAVWLILVAGCVCVQAQVCPSEHGDATAPSTLHGKIMYHDELRQWIGLKLDRPACDQSEIQLVFVTGDETLAWRKAKSLSGCQATVEGMIVESLTGYYSTDLNIADPKINVDPGCTPKPLEPDLYQVTVPKTVNKYNAEMKVDLRGKGRLDGSASNAQGRLLSPWQAYVKYMLTGGMTMWLECADDFVLSNPRRFPNAGDFDVLGGRIGMGLEDDADHVVVTYTCTREK